VVETRPPFTWVRVEEAVASLAADKGMGSVASSGDALVWARCGVDQALTATTPVRIRPPATAKR
jgi:hypothetical protein